VQLKQIKRKFKLSAILKKIKALKKIKHLRGKAVVGSVLMACSLWFYSNLNMDYVSYVVIPFMVKAPEGRAIENNLPATIAVEIRCTGWQMINFNFFNSSVKSIVDLSNVRTSDSTVEITRNDLIKSIQSLTNAQAIDVIPQSISIKTGRIGEYSVPVVSQVAIIPKDGFILVGQPEFKPDMINIAGNDRVVKKVKSWSTELLVLKDVYEPITVMIPLSDSLKNMVTLSQQRVRLITDIQQEADITFHDVKIKIKGNSIPSNHKIVPSIIKVTVKGGIDQIKTLTYDEITATIDYEDIIKDTTGIIVPTIEIPAGLKVVKVTPPYIYHQKIINVNKSYSMR